MKQRQKKKNMLKNISRQNSKLKELSKALAVVLDENAVLRRSCEDMSKKIDFFGTMPIYQPLSNRFIKEIETQDIILRPVPYGMVDQKRPSELLYRQMVDRKYDLAKSLAEAMIENHAVQFIHHPANDREGPMGKYDTLAVKLYFIPWQQAQIYSEDIREIVLAAKNNTNYALQITEEMRMMPKEWIDQLWREIQEWRV